MHTLCMRRTSPHTVCKPTCRTPFSGLCPPPLQNGDIVSFLRMGALTGINAPLAVLVKTLIDEEVFAKVGESPAVRLLALASQLVVLSSQPAH